MFEVPGAKRVCREDIKTPSSRSPSPGSPLPDSYAVDALRHLYSSLDTFTAHNDTSATNPDSGPAPTAHEDSEQEFEFRLFHSPVRNSTSNSQDNVAVATNPSEQEQVEKIIDNHKSNGIQKLKIRLRSPSPGVLSREGGFVVPFRGWSYYLSDPDKVLQVLQHDGTEETHGTQQSEYRESYLSVATTGEEVMALAKSSRWPGCHLPWRVIHIQSTTAKSSSPKSAITLHQREKKKRTKPGKKRRIVLRQRLASKKAEEEADRDKRTRRNREKKIKRRQREREKKAATRDAAGGAHSDEGQKEERSCQESS